MASSIAHTRIFVALTLAEAAAIGRLMPGTDADAIGGVAKIRTALAGVTSAPSATGAPPPLRAKYYVPGSPKLRMATVHPPPRMAKADRPPQPTRVSIDTAPQQAPAVDDYVPCRDEADGRWL